MQKISIAEFKRRINGRNLGLIEAGFILPGKAEEYYQRTESYIRGIIEEKNPADPVDTGVVTVNSRGFIRGENYCFLYKACCYMLGKYFIVFYNDTHIDAAGHRIGDFILYRLEE